MKYIVPQPDLTICDYESLSNEAKEKAYQDWYENSQSEYAWWYEVKDSMKVFAKLLDIKIDDYNIDLYSRSYINFHIRSYGDHVYDDLKGVRLWKYIRNILGIYECKYGHKTILNRIYKTYTKNNKTRKSKILCDVENNIMDCPLTGVYSDCSLMATLEEFLYPGKYKDVEFSANRLDMTLENLIDDCFENFIKDIKSDIEYSQSKEYFEECSATEKMYLENGTEYCDWSEFDKNNKDHHYQIVAE